MTHLPGLGHPADTPQPPSAPQALAMLFADIEFRRRLAVLRGHHAGMPGRGLLLRVGDSMWPR